MQWMRFRFTRNGLAPSCVNFFQNLFIDFLYCFVFIFYLISYYHKAYYENKQHSVLGRHYASVRFASATTSCNLRFFYNHFLRTGCKLFNTGHPVVDNINIYIYLYTSLNFHHDVKQTDTKFS